MQKHGKGGMRSVMARSLTLVLGLNLGLGLCLLSYPSEAKAQASAARGPAKPAAVFQPNMPRNTWIKLDVKYLPDPGGGNHRPQSWDKLVYDTVGKRAIFIDRWSDDVHGHSIYANAVLAFDPSSNQVACLKINNWHKVPKSGGGSYTSPMPSNAQDPTPCDRHPYGNVAFVPEQNAVYLSTGANVGAKNGDIPNHVNCDDTWRFDLSTNKWTKIESRTQPKGDFEEAMCYDPVNKVIVRLARNGTETWLLDIKTGQWHNANAQNNPRCGKAAAMCYDSKRGRMIVYGGPGRVPGVTWNTPGYQVWSYAVKENVWRQLPDAPLPARAPAIDYDPVNDCVVCHIIGPNHTKGQPGRTLFYLCDKNEWRMLPEEADANGPSATWQGLAYDSDRNIFIRTNYGEPGNTPYWWALRPDLSKTVPAQPAAKK